MKVFKFGGTSMATAAAVRRVESIVRGDERAKIIVVSAPGKRYAGDKKVTDLLLAAHDARSASTRAALLDSVENRFAEILCGLSLSLDFTREWQALRTAANGERAYAASRGEFFSAQIVAARLGATFIDAAELVRFDAQGNFNEEETNRRIRARLTNLSGLVVVPGFYGATAKGKIVTFARGGSDITGAVLAGACGAELYENLTDVDGFLAADPSVVPHPRVIECLTYEEARALGKMGAGVLHPSSIAPLKKAGVPARVRNTFNPQAKGTLIVPAEQAKARPEVVGIAGKCISQRRALVAVVGKGARAQSVCAVLERAHVRPYRVEQTGGALTACIPARDYAAAVGALYTALV